MRTKITNAHQAVLVSILGSKSEQWQGIDFVYRANNITPTNWQIAHQLDRLGCWRLRRDSRPSNALDDISDLEAELNPIPPPPRGIDGNLRVVHGRGFEDASGTYLPISCHHLNGLWLHANRREDSLKQLDAIAQKYDIVRTIMMNGMSYRFGNFWDGRDFYPSDRQYENTVDDYFKELHKRNLRLDITFEAAWTKTATYTDKNHLKSVMSNIGDIADAYPNLIALIEWNEGWQTYIHRNPAASELHEVLEAFTDNYTHQTIRAITDAQFEHTDDFNSLTWDIFTKHGWRMGNTEDRTRHIFTTKYEEGGIPKVWEGFDTEPPGFGTSVAEERNVEGMCVIHLMNLIAGYGTTYMSPDGIKWNKPIEQTPGFSECAKIRELLPIGVQRYRKAWHGGRSEAALFADFSIIPRVDSFYNGKNFVGLAYSGHTVTDGKLHTRRKVNLVVSNIKTTRLIFEGELNPGQTVNVSFERGVLFEGTEV